MRTNMMFGLKEETIEKINGLFISFPQVEEVVLYGSRAKGNYKPGSDIDLVLKGKDLDLSILYQITSKIDDLLLPYSFDISLFDQVINTALLEHINRVGKLFFDRTLITN